MLRLESATDDRFERCLQLLAVVNGEPAPESQAADYARLIAALRVQHEALKRQGGCGGGGRAEFGLPPGPVG